MGKKAKISAALAVLALGGFSCVYAADAAAAATPVYALKGITVTATRQAESTQDVPANVQVITEKDIKDRNITTAAQAVSMATGVSVSNSVEGTVNLRGYSSKNILVLVDGQQMNTAWNGDVDWNMIPVDNIRKVEVVSGGQSALYGGRAVGGVINIMTKTPKQDGVHGSALVSYGSNATVKQAYQVNGKTGKVTWGTFYESRITNGWKDYDVSTSSTNAKELGLTNKGLDRAADGGYIIGNRGKKYVLNESYGFNIGYNFNDDQKLTYKYTHSIYDWKYEDPETYTNSWYASKTEIINGKRRTYSYSPSGWGTKGWRAYNMHSLTYNDTKNKVHAHFGLTDYYKDGYTSPATTVKGDNLDGGGSKSSYPSKSWDFDINKRWTWGDHNVLVGASYGQDKFSERIYSSISNWKSWNSSLAASNRITHLGGKDKNYAIYVQDKWQFAPKWTAYIGGRYDHYKKYDGYGQATNKSPIETFDSASYNKFSPKLSLDYAWNDSTNIYVSYGKSFNPPILYQVYRYSNSRDTEYRPNPGLDPETTDTWELGLKKKIANKTDIHADVFYAKTKDAIKLTEIEEGVKRYDNVGDAKTHGFELSLNQHHSNAWTSYINYTWQTGKVDGDKDYDIPRHLLHLGTTYNKAPWTLNIDGMFISDRTEAGMERNHWKARDSYFLLNINTNYQVTKNFSMQFGIDNVFDRDYYDEDISTNHYYIGDGRTYTISARYTF